MKPKILLINPPYSLEERYGKNLKNFGGNAEPLGLAYIASSVIQDGYFVEILDATVNYHTVDQIINKIKSEEFTVVGMTMLTPMYSKVKEIVNKINEGLSGVITVLGGAHPTALPELTLSDIKPNFIVVGEGETTFRQLIYAIDSNGDYNLVDGLCFLNGENVVRTKPRKYEENIDIFPPPARELLNIEKYFLTATRVKGSSFCPTIIIARGCPFNCTYCSHPFGRTYRYHSVDRVIMEIETLVNKYNIDQMNFEADTLTINKKFIISLCDAIIKRGINKKIKWTCESRLDTIDHEMLCKMKEAGCWQISIGIESGVNRLLKSISKGEDTEIMKEKVKIIKKVGISIRGFFMLGLPGETKEDSLQTIKFAKELNPDWAQFTITIPYPGTPMFEELKAKGEINSYNWDDYKTWSGWTENKLPFIAKGRTQEELKNLQRFALKSFYLRPKMFFKFLKRINSFESFKKYFIGFLIILKVKKTYLNNNYFSDFYGNG